MKKFFKGLITLLFGLMLLGLIWGFFLESSWKIQVSQPIKAEAAVIYPYLNTLREWPSWTVWNNKKYPDLVINYEGETSGIGAIQRWDDGHTQGIVHIVRSDLNRSIGYELSMAQESIRMQGEIILEPRGDATEVRWLLSGDSGANPIARLLMLAYQPVIESDLKTNLRQLDERIMQLRTSP
jgi:hypothetical protein